MVTSGARATTRSYLRCSCYRTNPLSLEDATAVYNAAVAEKHAKEQLKEARLCQQPMSRLESILEGACFAVVGL